MERRAFQRVSLNIEAHFYCNNTDYSGTITNMSENGLFIRMNEVAFPFEPEVDIFIRRKEMLLKIPVKVRRLTKSKDIFDGMGVQVMNPSRDYLDFVKKMKYAQNTL